MERLKPGNLGVPSPYRRPPLPPTDAATASTEPNQRCPPDQCDVRWTGTCFSRENEECGAVCAPGFAPIAGSDNVTDKCLDNSGRSAWTLWPPQGRAQLSCRAVPEPEPQPEPEPEPEPLYVAIAAGCAGVLAVGVLCCWRKKAKRGPGVLRESFLGTGKMPGLTKNIFRAHGCGSGSGSGSGSGCCPVFFFGGASAGCSSSSEGSSIASTWCCSSRVDSRFSILEP
eukprot:COSAG04_NODE_3248_length_3008_cov_94.952217_1_plen_227_part_00